MKGLQLVFGKEVRETLRDRRSVMSALLFGPLMGPILFALMISTITKMESERAEQALELPVIGAENAPGLVSHLERQGVVIKAPPDDAEAVVRDETETVVLEIPVGFAERFQSNDPATVKMTFDASRRDARTIIERVKRMVEGYGALVGVMRLQVRGIDPSITRAIMIEEHDLSTPESRGALLLAMLPYFLMIAVFMGGMYLAIDATAGERERQSLEPLMINPVPRWQIMGGKLLATAVFSSASLAITLLAFSQSMKLIPADSLGISLSMGLREGVFLFFVVAPVAFLAAALQTVISAFARTFREAQTYLSMLLLLPMVPSLALFVVPVKGQLWMMSVPIMGQNLIIEKVLRVETVDATSVAVSMACTTLAGLALALVAARIYGSERLAMSS